MPAVEDAVLLLLLFGALGLAVLQIALRLLLDTGLDWIGPLIRVIMVWLGLWAAMIAAREGRHITMDALGAYLPALWKARLRRLTDGFAALVCLLLAYAAWNMTTMSREFADIGPLGWPLWGFQAVMPLAFAVMGLRYLWHVWAGWPEDTGPNAGPGAHG